MIYANYSALELGTYILHHLDTLRMGASYLKLNQILYFVQQEFLAKLGYPAFNEDIKAVGFGVCIWEILNKYAVYGNGAIPIWPDKDVKICLLEKEKEIIDDVSEKIASISLTAINSMIFESAIWKNARAKAKFYYSPSGYTITREELYENATSEEVALK